MDCFSLPFSTNRFCTSKCILFAVIDDQCVHIPFYGFTIHILFRSKPNLEFTHRLINCKVATWYIKMSKLINYVKSGPGLIQIIVIIICQL
jgi:hypothetical protein